MKKSGLFVFILCFLFFFRCNMKPTIRKIADSIQIDKSWTEIHPTPPLVASEQIQSISIDMPKVSDWEIRPDSASFVTPGGQVVKVEVELVAIDGTIFRLESVGLGPGLMFSRHPQDHSPTASRLPKGMAFATVRVRSDMPIQGGQVAWICITNY